MDSVNLVKDGGGYSVPDGGGESPALSPALYPHPFSAAYWRAAAAEVRDLRKLTFAALMIAACTVLGYLPSVMVWQAKISWGFLARALCAWVCGPVLGLAFGFAEDILGFFLTGGSGQAFFPGYTLSTMLGVFLYALFFYRTDLTVWRVFLAKFLTNVENVLLGTLWSAIMTGKAWMVLAPARALKNLVMFPIQSLLLCALFAALLPALRRAKLIPYETAARLRL